MAETPRTRKGHRTRQKVLEAAADVFASDGYNDARMVDIATAAGLSVGGLYRYFENKTEVFAALITGLDEGFYGRSGETETSLANEPLAVLTEANRRYIEHYEKNRHVMRAFIEAAAVEKRFRMMLHEMRGRHARCFAQAYRDLYGDGLVGGERVELAAEALTCMVEHCCYVWFAQSEETGRRVSVDDAVATTNRAWCATILAERQS
jgi:AcrR family transcriptional regulator